MKREDTIAKLAAQMLQGKSEDFVRKFYEKDTNKQYAAVMNWRRKMKKIAVQVISEEREDTLETLLADIKALGARIDKLPSLNDDGIDRVEAELGQLGEHLLDVRRAKRKAEIESLLRQQEEIAIRLRQLTEASEEQPREREEPNLFNME